MCASVCVFNHLTNIQSQFNLIENINFEHTKIEERKQRIAREGKTHTPTQNSILNQHIGIMKFERRKILLTH